MIYKYPKCNFRLEVAQPTRTNEAKTQRCLKFEPVWPQHVQYNSTQ